MEINDDKIRFFEFDDKLREFDENLDLFTKPKIDDDLNEIDNDFLANVNGVLEWYGL